MWQRYVIVLGGVIFGFIIHQWFSIGSVLPNPVLMNGDEGIWIGSRSVDPTSMKLRGTVVTLDAVDRLILMEVQGSDDAVIPLLVAYDETTTFDTSTRKESRGRTIGNKVANATMGDLKTGASALVYMNTDGKTFHASSIIIYE